MPRANAWICPALCDTAAGSPLMTPPRVIHALHLLPSQSRSQTALSVPRQKTSSLPSARDAAVGPAPAGSTPPRELHADQTPSAYDLCQTCASVPRTKTSTLPEPHETAAGLLARTPPSEVHPLQLPASSRSFSTRLSPVPSAKTCTCGAFMEAIAGAEATEPPRSSAGPHPP